MKKILGCILFVFSLTSFAFAQDGVRVFKDVKIDAKEKEVTFYLVGLDNKYKLSELQDVLQADKNIIYAKIYEDSKCHLKMKSKVDADYVYDVIRRYEVDFDYSFVEKKIDENTNIQSEVFSVNPSGKILPSDFPKRKNTGDPKEDERRHFSEIQKWKEENPDRWQEILDNRK